MSLDNTFSRRDFLSGSLVAAGTLTTLGMLGCSSEPKEGNAADNSSSSTPAQEVSETIDTDIVIVGGGFSGMACAVQSALNGDRVVLLEAQNAMGGGGMALEITCGVGSSLATACDIHYEANELVRAEMENAAWSVDGGLWLDLIKNSGKNIDWLIEQGVEYEPTVDEYHIMQFTGTYKVAHWYKDGYAGSGYVPQMTERIEGLDIDVRTETRGTDFIFDEKGAISGVYATVKDKNLIQINAKAFVIATGSFAQDEERLREQGYNPDKIDILAMPGHYGDGIRMVLSAGGTEFIGGSSLIYNRIGELSTFDTLNGALCSGGPFLWINQDCERYTDEYISLEKSMCPLQAEGTRINKQVFAVFDKAIFDERTGGDSSLAAEWEEAIKANPDAIYTSDDLYELPSLAGLDAETFKATVDLYNSYAEAGADGDFGKDPSMLRPLKNGPYYLAEIHIAMEGPLYGVNIDRHFRVVDNERNPIENLFAIGLDSMSIYKSTYPMAVPGSASAECINGARTASNKAHQYLAGL